MGFAASSRKVLVPAGRSGNLDLVDPNSKQVKAINGFSRHASFGGGHDQGVTSADEGRGLLFATDRSSRQLAVIDPKTRAIIATASLAAGPDYVRYIATTSEIWVTEPGSSGIIAYNPKLAHAYVPGEESATMTVIGISSKGVATVLRTVRAASGSHCAAADDRNNAYICDPSYGRLLVFKDDLPESK
jgi:DNA-binding beta-propeller fold protein YncE